MLNTTNPCWKVFYFNFTCRVAKLISSLFIPFLAASVSVISFLILRLAEEQAKQTGNAGDNPAFLEQFQPPRNELRILPPTDSQWLSLHFYILCFVEHNNLAIQLERDDGHSRDVEESEAAIKPTKAPTYRDSLLQASPRSG